MKRPWLSALFLALAAAGLVALHRWGPTGLYAFDGHGGLLNDAVHGCLWLLVLTHLLLAGIIWTQRSRWDRADASCFRFVGVKALFWGYEALTVPNRNGASLTTVYLLAVIALSTLDFDVELVRRYVASGKDRP